MVSDGERGICSICYFWNWAEIQCTHSPKLAIELKKIEHESKLLRIRCKYGAEMQWIFIYKKKDQLQMAETFSKSDETLEWLYKQKKNDQGIKSDVQSMFEIEM